MRLGHINPNMFPKISIIGSQNNEVKDTFEDFFDSYDNKIIIIIIVDSHKEGLGMLETAEFC